MVQLLIVTPSLSEYRAVRPYTAGLEAAKQAELVMSGIGPECSGALCRRLDETAAFPPFLVLVGVAGGLDPSLASGDIVVASSNLDQLGRRAPCAVIALPGATVGPLLTVSRALNTPVQKAAGRESGALAVEMEAYPLAAWAAQHELRFIHARVILDAAGETLPEMGSALDEYGRLRPVGLLRQLLAHPSQIVPLLRLQRRMRIIGPALGRLAQAVAEMCLVRQPHVAPPVTLSGCNR